MTQAHQTMIERTGGDDPTKPLARIKGLSHPVRILATHNGIAWVSGCIDNPTDAEHDNGRLVRVADLEAR